MEEQTTIDDNIKIINLKNKTIKITINDFNENIDIEDILKIDYANIIGELLTFPVILNRFGVLLADMDNLLRETTFNLKIAKDNLDLKKAEFEKKQYLELKKTINAPTVTQISGAVLQDPEYQAEVEKYRIEERKLMKVQHDKDNINSIYWSSKMKSDILTKMTDKIQPKDFEGEILEGRINGMMIKVRDKLIKDI